MPSSLNARSSQQTPSSFTPPPDPRLPSAPYGQPSHTHQRGGGHYAPIPYEQGQSSSRPGEAMIPSTQQHPPGAIPAQYWDFNGHDEQNANGKRARQGSSPPATLRTRQNPAESMPPPPPPAAPDQAPQPGTHTHATQPPSNQGQSSDGDLPLTAPFVIPDSLTVAQANATNWVSGFQMLTGTGVTPEESEVALSVATSAFQTKEFIEEFLKFREVVRGIVNVDPRFVGLTQEQRHAIAEQWMIAELGRTGVKKAVSKVTPNQGSRYYEESYHLHHQHGPL
ncbi:hypothetical protein NMY22_g18703 [Coprinellus aureogranulatus]|nr:hypothetical protein NMY22_g18703 [Coprinellus aureogranulatus]